MMIENLITNRHKPVMVVEVISAFGLLAHLNNAKSEGLKIIDATLGSGGHSLELVNHGSSILGIEADPQMLAIARQKLGSKSVLVNDNFRNIDRIAKTNDFDQCDGILFDLGVNTVQLTSNDRGLSFSNPGAGLDMRLNPELQGPTGADLLNVLQIAQLESMFDPVMGWSDSRFLAYEINKRRKTSRFETVGDLLEIVNKLHFKGKLHPATKVFLALRMAVNSELQNLEEALPRAFSVLKPGGKIVVISFHSLEDRIVKDYFRDLSRSGLGDLVTKKPLKPSSEEIFENPNSRSAKLRVLTKK